MNSRTLSSKMCFWLYFLFMLFMIAVIIWLAKAVERAQTAVERAQTPSPQIGDVSLIKITGVDKFVIRDCTFDESVIEDCTFDDLLDAIEWVESRGDANSVGDYKVVEHYETCSHSPSCPDWHICNGTHCMIAGVYRAVGAYQLTKIYVDDVNRILVIWWKSLNKIFENYNKLHPDPNNIKSVHSDPYTYEDRWDRDYSRFMTEVYLTYYAPLDNSMDINLEATARIHNGGPDGWRNDPQWFVRNRGYKLKEAEKKIENTRAYWQKIKERLTFTDGKKAD